VTSRTFRSQSEPEQQNAAAGEDALEKQNFVSHGDVIEQDQMLVDLAHVA
jgi:hypothetical protein